MSDVIASGRERDPWRPSRRLVMLAALALVFLAALAFGGRELQRQRAEQAADERAAQRVVLDVGQVASRPLDWELDNRSATVLTVTSARLDFPPGELFVKPQQLRPYGSLTLRPSQVVCDEGLYNKGPSVLVVEALTANGQRLTRRLSLDAEAKIGIWTQLRGACQIMTPADALVGEIVKATWSGSTVRLTYGLSNVGGQPLTLEAVTYLPGVTVRAVPQPLVLPVREAGTLYAPIRHLVVELHVASCGQLETVLRAAHGGDGLDGPGTLKPQLRDAHARESGYLDLGDHAERLQRTCPSIASLLDSWR